MHIDIYAHFKDVYRDPAGNIAGKVIQIRVLGHTVLGRVKDTYLIVVPETLWGTRGYIEALYATWPHTQKGEILILC